MRGHGPPPAAGPLDRADGCPRAVGHRDLSTDAKTAPRDRDPAIRNRRSSGLGGRRKARLRPARASRPRLPAAWQFQTAYDERREAAPVAATRPEQIPFVRRAHGARHGIRHPGPIIVETAAQRGRIRRSRRRSGQDVAPGGRRERGATGHGGRPAVLQPPSGGVAAQRSHHGDPLPRESSGVGSGRRADHRRPSKPASNRSGCLCGTQHDRRRIQGPGTHGPAPIQRASHIRSGRQRRRPPRLLDPG